MPVSLAPGPPDTELASASLVLGILSLTCLLALAGIPAVICGHVARSRARRMPGAYAGQGRALAGLVTGYISLVLSIAVLPVMLLSGLAHAKARAQSVACSNNLKQLGVAFNMWAYDHTNQLPFQVSITNGGTAELCQIGRDGYDSNGLAHIQVLTNELGGMTRVLVCPADSKTPAASWNSLTPANLSYRVRSGSNVDQNHLQEVLVVCPIHGHELLVDGSVLYEQLKQKK